MNEINDIHKNGAINQEKPGLLLVSDIIPDNLNILPLHSRPLFPGLTLPLTFTGEKFIHEIQFAIEKDKNFMGVVFTKNNNPEEEKKVELYDVGTLIKL